MEEKKAEKLKTKRHTRPDQALMNWKPAAIITPRNHICSSKFEGKKPFYPKYLRDKNKADIGLLLSEEYRRMWFQALEEHRMFEVDESQSMPNRPYLIRNRKPANAIENEKRFIMKRFQAIASKTDSGLKKGTTKLESSTSLQTQKNIGNKGKRRVAKV